ncbi:MAG TPA: RNA polymerase factor sigma-54, partial [Rubrivivax sp.]|nr:RNA polymerase factor sigma-54 [Rubrivivax sp.]
MKPSLQVRLSQHLALTPQLQQSIRLLQLSTLELQQEVEQMLELNPFLEADDEALAFDTAPSERAEAKADAAAERDDFDGGDGGDGALPEVKADDFGATEREDWENGTERDDFDGIRETPGLNGSAAADTDDGEFERGGGAITLQEHLRGQMAGMRLGGEDRAALQILIESLDGDGYLADTLDDIAARLAEMLGMAVDDAEAHEDLRSRLQCALNWLHSMEPPGVGARDLAECLSLQLRAGPRSAAQALALLICKQHLELLAKRDFKRLGALTGAGEELLREAQALIQQCEPKPGRAFEHTETYAVVPDVIVRRSGRGLKVALNPDVMPKLRINDLYAQALRGARGTNGANGAHAGLSARLQEARWFMKNIQQRFDTILRVSSAIVERQKAFFTHGEIAMKPLVLREIADELGLHESTISRVTSAKYLASPIGTYELKYFFGSSLNTDAGGNASSTAVR